MSAIRQTGNFIVMGVPRQCIYFTDDDDEEEEAPMMITHTT